MPKKARQYNQGEEIGKFGITYLSETKKRRYGKFNLRYANFICHCSKIFEANISAVKRGHTSSCGCVKLKMFVEFATIHGMCTTPIYHLWQSMRNRIEDKSFKQYKDYGGRGIIIFPPWKEDFMLFFDYVSALSNYGIKGLTLDRIDNNGNYEPGNLRWTTKHIQSTNTRMLNTNTSGYTGVYKHKNIWVAQIVVMREHHYLGHYRTKEQAVTARNNYIIANNLSEYKIQSILS